MIFVDAIMRQPGYEPSAFVSTCYEVLAIGCADALQTRGHLTPKLFFLRSLRSGTCAFSRSASSQVVVPDDSDKRT